MKTHVDSELCTGCGLCVETCPEAFEMDDDAGVAVATAGQVPADFEDTCRQAAEECPVDAISIDE